MYVPQCTELKLLLILVLCFELRIKRELKKRVACMRFLNFKYIKNVSPIRVCKISQFSFNMTVALL